MLIGGLTLVSVIFTAIALYFYIKREDEKASGYALISIATVIVLFILMLVIKIF